MDLLILFGSMVVFFAIGVPIGICLIFPCFILLFFNQVTSASFLAQSFYTGVASSSMIALPFFMICGNIMDKGGIYFGENAISHNLIMCNKANLLNQSAFLLGVPGSGKCSK